MIWWVMGLALCLGAALMLTRWPLINDVQTDSTAEYPNVRSQVLNGPFDEVFDAALSTARGMGWRIAVANPDFGVIDAVARTPVLRFRDDVRIQLLVVDPGQVQVAIRSSSRIGRGDFGTNARRILKYQQQLDHAWKLRS